MPNNGLSVGHDVSVDIFDGATNAIIAFPAPTHFTCNPNTKQIVSEPLNTPPLYAENPNGWKGELEFDRTSPAIDNYFASKEDDYWAGRPTVSGSITETIQEKDGSVSQFRLEGVALKLENAGSWKAAEKVTLKVSWAAGRRRKVV